MFSSYYMTPTGHVSPNKMHESDVAVVVISPEDREQVERLRKAAGRKGCLAINRIEEMQAALRSLIEPPRPPEPTGLGAVVEAACVHNSTRGRWVRNEDGQWHRGAGPDDWDSLIDPKVLSEGLS